MPLPAFGQDETFAVRPSKILFWWIVLSTAATSGLTWLYLPPWYGLGFAMGCAGLAVHAIAQHALLKRQGSVTAIRIGRSGLAVQQRDGKWQAPDVAIPLGGFVSPILTVIRLNSEQVSVRHTVVLLSDSLDPDAARRLRVWLRWTRDKAPNSVAE